MANEVNNCDDQVILERVGGGPSHVILSHMTTGGATNTSVTSTGKSQFKGIQHKSGKSPKRIPPWLWIIIAKSLGIRLKSGEKPFLSSLLHLLTFGSATRKF